MRYFALPLILSTLIWQNASYAQQCGETWYTKEGESLYSLSATAYGDERKWSTLYYANQKVLGSDPGNVASGIGLRIPCLDVEAAPDQTPFQRLNADLKLLTGGNYAPWTDQDLPGGGLITELVNASFEKTPSPVSFSLTWQDDWAVHLSPLIEKRVFDIGFPWFKPDCEDNRQQFRCRTFHFSEPLFEMQVPLYYHVDRPIEFASDSDILGKRICRPKGYFIHDLDRADRRWISEEKIEFVQADSMEDCFSMLIAGEIDAATINEFTGRLKIQLLGLDDQIIAADRPLSVEGLHGLISKSHPRGTTFLYRFNAGLAELKKTTRYREIIDRHLTDYWSQIEEPPKADADPDPEVQPVIEENDLSTDATDDTESNADESDESVEEINNENAIGIDIEKEITEVPDQQAQDQLKDEAGKETESVAEESVDASIEMPQSDTPDSETVNETTQQDADQIVSHPSATQDPEASVDSGDDSNLDASVKTETNTETETADSNAVGLSDQTPTDQASSDEDTSDGIAADQATADESFIGEPSESANEISEQDDEDTESLAIETQQTPDDDDREDSALDAVSQSEQQTNTGDEGDSNKTADALAEESTEMSGNDAEIAASTEMPDANSESEPTSEAVKVDESQVDTEPESAKTEDSEQTAKKKRCKTLPYFCRMFGLD